MFKERMSYLSGLCALLLIFAACSGGGGSRRGGGGRYCEADQEKTFRLPDQAQKKAFKTSGKSALPKGDYIFDRADFLYVYKPDKDPSTWVMIQVAEDRRLNKKSNVTKSRYCVRGLTPDTRSFEAEITGIRNLQVTQEKAIAFTPRTYSFRWNQVLEKLEVDSFATEEEFDAPEKVFLGKASDLKVFKKFKDKNNNEYEILSQKDYPDRDVTLYLKVRMLRKNLKDEKPE